MTIFSTARYWFLKTALSYLGTTYIWGGDDPFGFDCSGFVVECLKTVGLLKESEDYTADALYNFLSFKQDIKGFSPKLLETPQAGALLFYFNNKKKAHHITICLDQHFQIGASGGDKNTTSRVAAQHQNAFVKIRPIYFNPDKMKLIQIFE